VTLPPIPAPTPGGAADLSFAIRLDAALAVLVLLLAFLLASFPPGNSDVWLHLAAGRLLAEGRYRFGIDPFAHTTGRSYWANHAWLIDLISFIVYRALGGAALVVLKAVLLGTLAAVLLVLSRPGQGSWLAVASTGLAILAIGAWLPLQPVCVSYLFLALTLFFLERPNRLDLSPPSWASYWPLLPLFALWVNLDGWFLLGPLTVALYAAGEGLRSILGPRQERSNTAALGVIFLAGLAMCLLSPHHVHAFVLPVPLGLSEAAAGLGDDPLGRTLRISPLESAYFRSVLGRSVVGLAYFPLVLLSAGSFVLDRSGWQWRRAIPWLAFLLLSLYQARTVPFFAVVAGPILARNLQDALRTRPALGWRIPPRWPLAGRLVVVLLGVALVVAAWPGWLSPGPSQPRGWTVSGDPSLERLARLLGRWRAEGRLPEEALGFNFTPEVAHHFAWFCPEERGFFDGRLTLFSKETAEGYRAVRRALLAPPGTASDGPDWRAVLRAARVTHLILSDRNPQRRELVLGRLLLSPEWVLLAQEGQTALFAWLDLARPNSSGLEGSLSRLRLDLNRLAFHPAVEKRAPLAWPGRGPQPVGLLEPFWRPAPALSADREEATAYLTHFEALRGRYVRTHRALWESTLVAGLAGASGTPVGGPASRLAALALGINLLTAGLKRSGPEEAPWNAGDLLALQMRARFVLHLDSGPPGLALLAIRAARRALHDDPDDAQAYLLLGEAYHRLISSTRERVLGVAFPYLAEVRLIQTVTALKQALVRRPDLQRAHFLLAGLFRDMGYLDLALEHFQKHLEHTRAAGPLPGEPPAAFAARLAGLEKDREPLEKRVAEANKLHEVHSANLKVFERAYLARRNGLAGKGLRILLASDNAAFGRPGLLLELELLLSTGRVTEVREWMEPAHKAALGASRYGWLRAQLAAATGGYQQADKELAELVALSRQVRVPGKSAMTVRAAVLLGVSQAVLGAVAPPGHTDPSAFGLLLPLRMALGAAGTLRQEADLAVVRGLLALEAGADRLAEKQFGQALATGSPGKFSGRTTALRYLHLLRTTGQPARRSPWDDP
jgi:tetratricopeptide (TPR) repeat protein